ncbi:hypothetical protein [Streptomyces sp. NPDC054849]
MSSATHWSAYDGRARRPRAEVFRAVCACGWRSTAEYPLDWDTIGDLSLFAADVDLTGPLADWAPGLAGQLTATATDAPLAALRAAGALERIAAARRPPARCATTACPPKRCPPHSGPPAPRPCS